MSNNANHKLQICTHFLQSRMSANRKMSMMLVYRVRCASHTSEIFALVNVALATRAYWDKVQSQSWQKSLKTEDLASNEYLKFKFKNPI